MVYTSNRHLSQIDREKPSNLTNRTVSAAARRALLRRLLLGVEPVVVVAVLVVQNAVPGPNVIKLFTDVIYQCS
jgi:hypothetical protein